MQLRNSNAYFVRVELQAAYFIGPKKGRTDVHIIKVEADRALCGYSPSMTMRRVKLYMGSRVTCSKCLGSVAGRDLLKAEHIIVSGNRGNTTTNQQENENDSRTPR